MAEAAKFFRRFRVADREAALKEIAREEMALAAAVSSGDEPAQLIARLHLGFHLTPLDREEEAVGHLEAALGLAKKLHDKSHEIEVLLHLATAVQYAGDRERALALFAEGLDRAQSYGVEEQVHFLLHHRGRCEVELGRIERARQSFAAALAIREKIGIPRLIDSTQAALKDIEGR